MGSFPYPWLLVDSLSFLMCLRSLIHGIWAKRQVLLFQTSALYAHINIEIGSQSCPNANEIRRKTEQRAIHKVKAEENLHLVAHLSSDLALYVSSIPNWSRTKKLTRLRCFNNGAAGSQPIFQQWVISGHHHRQTYSDTWQVPQKLKRSCIFNQPDQFDTNHHPGGSSRDNPRLRMDIGYYSERQPLAPSHLRCCEYNTP